MKSQGYPISKKAKIFVGMSGGVDSSVSAALLKEAGHEVTGVFIKVWQPDWIECNWKEERLEAMRAAAHLGIPFVTLDLVQEYKQGVIDYMISEYALGRTPNPDVMCNREVKFGGFWRWAQSQGAEYVATGHYARITAGQAMSSLEHVSRRARHKEGGIFKLLAGTDTNKDQSYFLWTLNQNDVPHILFPVGHLTKPEVRILAQKFGLPNALKKDSQGLCFIGTIDVKDFLSRYIKTEKGNVLNEKGEIIGTHNGSLLLTIGERRGFTITTKTPHDTPYYVVSKNVERNEITVAQRVSSSDINIQNLDGQEVRLERVNWVGVVPQVGSKIQVRTRYRQPLQDIEIVSTEGSKAVISFMKRQDTITPGQSAVMYDGEVCLGGGIIE